MIYWILVVVSMFGGVHYESFGYGPSNGADCKAVAAAIDPVPYLDAHCVGANRTE